MECVKWHTTTTEGARTGTRLAPVKGRPTGTGPTGAGIEVFLW